MRLQYLRLRGFKSFCDPTLIEWEGNLIGIVGPNGAGKSNLADALRWVLGESRGRNLRIEKAEQIIFAGSASAKPAPYAEVSLGMRTQENTLIEFTRRLWRSTESEYLINGTPARLKDFYQHFWESGLSAQVIWDRSHVEDVLLDRNGARRHLIEIAAAIDKYHHQKKEAQIQLTQTEISLQTLDQVLIQLKENLEQTQKAAEKVLRYKKLKQEWMTLLRRVVWTAHQKLLAKKKEITQQLHAHQQTLDKLRRELASYQQDLHQAEKNVNPTQFAQIEAEVTQRRQHLHQIQTSYHQLEQKRAQKKLAYDALVEDLTRIQNQRQELMHFLESHTQKVQNLAESFAHQQNEYQKLQEAIHTHKETLRHYQTQYATLAATCKKAETSLHQLEKQNEKLSAEVHFLTQQQERLIQSLSEIRQTLHTLTEQLVQFTQEKKRIEALWAEEKKKVARYQEEKKHLEVQKQLFVQESQAYKQKIQELDTQHNVLEALHAKGEFLPPFMQGLRKLAGVQSLADLFYAEESFLPVLALLLAHYPNALVVDSPATWEKICAELQAQGKGFVQVFIREEIKATTFPLWLEHIIAMPQDKEIAAFLWDKPWSYDAGVMTGKGWRSWQGTAGTETIGIPYKLQKLQKEREALQGMLSQVETQIGRLEERLRELPLAQCQAQVGQLESTLQKLSWEEQKSQQLLDQEKKRQANLENEWQALTLKLQQSQEDLSSCQERYQVQHEAFESLIAQQKEIRQKLEKTEKAEKEKNQLVQQQWMLLHTIESQYQTAQKEGQFYQQQLKRVLQNAQEKSQLMQKLQTEIAQLTRACQEMENQIITAQRVLQEKEALYEQAQEKMQDFQERQKMLWAQIHQLQEKHQHVAKIHSDLQTTYQNLTHEMTLVHQRWALETSLPWENLEAQPPDPLEESSKKAEEKLTQLEQEIQALAPLNFESEAQYQTLKEKYENLLHHQADLRHFVERLKSLIRSLDKQAATRFLETFSVVRENFIRFFRTLFQATDDCDLVLVQEHEPLVSPIEVYARPKGKKPATLQQLSGGERTLTALALLFALFSYKPSPICILDEVDAPLDEPNTERFIHLVRTFTPQTQFLLITHNKRTMMGCDRLYGITMPQVGISHVLIADWNKITA
ncbi:MAG: AAA family ATPase [Bacteroidia bacterium]